MEIISIKTYDFEELEDSAKQKAIERLNDINMYDEWWDFVFEDVKEIAYILGIEIDNIYFRGFSSQGDGAMFEGSYAYKKESTKKIKSYAPEDKELHEIALNLSRIQKANFYNLSAIVKHEGRYYHPRSNNISVYNQESNNVTDDHENGIAEALRDFMRWIYKRLEEEHDNLRSDVTIKETLEQGNYRFLEDGTLYK